MDKGGNFIGWLYFENHNLSVMLVEHGLSSVHSTAEGSKFSKQLSNAESDAKTKKLNIWANYIEEEKEEKVKKIFQVEFFVIKRDDVSYSFSVNFFSIFTFPNLEHGLHHNLAKRNKCPFRPTAKMPARAA